MALRALVLMVMIIALLIESNFGHDAPDVTIEYFHRDGDNKDIRSRNINIFFGYNISQLDL